MDNCFQRTSNCILFQIKVGLQLYQVDRKSFLLDFKSLGPDDFDTKSNSSMTSLDEKSEEASHHVMEFFEICSSLIIALAC